MGTAPRTAAQTPAEMPLWLLLKHMRNWSFDTMEREVKLQAKILEVTRSKPKDGSTHWSCRKLAAQLGVSKDTVQRIWHKAGPKPHQLERYMADDPDFERKAADIIRLYLNPPPHAAVFCVDEKSAIQAFDRLDPVLPMSPGRAEGTVSNIIVTAHCRSTPLWMCAAARSTAKRQPATPATSS